MGLIAGDPKFTKSVLHIFVYGMIKKSRERSGPIKTRGLYDIFNHADYI